MSKASEKICDVLIEAGIDHVFGIPGGGTVPIWDALFDRQDKIKVILCRHEQAAGCMADMYGRLTGKPGVLMGQGAFIATSGGFGILEGYLSNTPMLVLTDTSDMGYGQHGSYQSGTGEYGSFDIVAILKAMSKFTTCATTPEEAVHGVQFAIKHALTGRTGPACVVMRSKAVTGEVNPERFPRIHALAGLLPGAAPVPAPAQIEKAVQLIVGAARPVIIAGNGVHLAKAYAELQALAERLGAPVTTSYKGKSVFPEVHPLALGMMGTFGQKVANGVVADADVLIVVGCHLGPSDTRFDSPQLIDPGRQQIVQIDIDPRNAGWTNPVALPLVGDARQVLAELTAKLRGKVAADTVRQRTEALAARKEAESFCTAPECASDASPLFPQRIVKEIEAAVPRDALITLDAGNNRLWMTHFLRSKRAGSVITPGGAAGMGWGPPAAVAAKILQPDRPVLSVAGDGGFAMVSNVLSTAVQYKAPVVFLVMNNSVLAMVHNYQSMRQRVIATEFSPTDDVAAIGRAYGCRGVKVSRPEQLAQEIKKGFKAELPTVLDVATDAAEPFLKIVVIEDLLRNV